MVKKDLEKNILIVGTQSETELFSDTIELRHVHFLSGELSFPRTGKGKIRYRQEDQDCTVFLEDEQYKVRFTTPQRAVASGQTFVLYDEWDRVVLSGEIL